MFLVISTLSNVFVSSFLLLSVAWLETLHVWVSQSFGMAFLSVSEQKLLPQEMTGSEVMLPESVSHLDLGTRSEGYQEIVGGSQRNV